jgi:hypothetical protein
MKVSDILTASTYIDVGDKVIKCTATHKSKEPFFIKYRPIHKEINKFNDITYDNNALYAVVYMIGSKVYTKIIDKAGFINDCSAEFISNNIPLSQLRTAEDVTNTLNMWSFGKSVDSFGVYKLRQD